MKYSSALSQYFTDIKDTLVELLIKIDPNFCFEWGFSGYSTLYSPSLLPKLQQWYSIEHNENWHRIINEKVSDHRIKLSFVSSETNFQPKFNYYSAEIKTTVLIYA